jgi:hypothetical protein
LNHPASTIGDARRILELEIENERLQRLVAELLVKNQQLRLKRQLFLIFDRNERHSSSGEGFALPKMVNEQDLEPSSFQMDPSANISFPK